MKSAGLEVVDGGGMVVQYESRVSVLIKNPAATSSSSLVLGPRRVKLIFRTCLGLGYRVRLS